MFSIDNLLDYVFLELLFQSNLDIIKCYCIILLQILLSYLLGNQIYLNTIYI
jgi:hypothetical protein